MRKPRSLPKAVVTGSVDIPSSQGGTYVYRGYCRCGDLLYVGVTNDIFSRLAGHRRAHSAWEMKMVRLEYDIYQTRPEALRVERRLIGTLGPLYNVANAVRQPRPVPLPSPRAFTEDELDGCARASYRGVSYLDWVFTEAGVAA